MEMKVMSRNVEYDYYVALITATATEEAGLWHMYDDWKPLFLEGDDQKYYETSFERSGKTLKVVTAIFCFLISGAILYYLFMTRELLRRRSFWMTVAAACIIVCLLFSLILKFPAPKFTLPQ